MCFLFASIGILSFHLNSRVRQIGGASGDQHALQLARVPSEAQEQQRMASRQHDQLVEERQRLGAKGNAMLLSQGIGSWSNWWRPKAWSQLSRVAPPWLLERLQIWVDVLKILD